MSAVHVECYMSYGAGLKLDLFSFRNCLSIYHAKEIYLLMLKKLLLNF